MNLLMESKPRVTDKIYNYGYRTPRFPMDFSLLLQTNDRLPALLEAHCSDLSEDGLAAEIAAPLEIGAKVTLILTLPGNPTAIRLSATVTNQNPGGYGFAFIFSSPSQRNYISDYLAAER
ncbi:MAG: PilZ domain-containing protein [Terriglobales bacterium]|jgi:hypothetical protein